MKRLISKAKRKDILNFKYVADEEENYICHFEDKDGYLVLNYCDEVLIVMQPLVSGGFLFQSKTCRMGTNSDLLFWDDIKIEIISEMFEKGLLEWGNL